MLAFQSLSFLHLAIVVKSLDNQFFLFSGSSVLAEVFAEFIALNGDVVLLRLFLLHNKLHAIAVQLAFLCRLLHALRL